MKHFVIERRNLLIDLTLPTTKNKGKVYEVFQTIEELLWNSKEDIYLFDKNNLDDVTKYANKDDEVTLYGAHLGMCLAEVDRKLTRQGAKVHYHPTGCF